MPNRPTSTSRAALLARLRHLVMAGITTTGIVFTALFSLAATAPNASASTVPAAANYWSHVPQFGSYGNVTTNDCSLAAVGALQQVWSASVGKGGQALAPAPVLTAYMSLVHGHDTGVLPNQAFAAWEQGIDGTEIYSVGALTTSQASVERAVWQLGGIYAIIKITGNDTQHPNVPTANTGSVTPWSLNEPTHPGAFAAEAHAVAVVGYNSQYVYLATWGAVQPVTWSWWNARVVQAWSLLPATYSSLGHGPVSTINSLKHEFFVGALATRQIGPYAS